jgi:hypothetical protein
MTDPQQQHRATPEQWEHVMFYAKGEEKFGTDSCILELRDRIAALEASAGIGQPVTPANTSAPADSLVERVQNAISDVEFPHGTDEARAAIHAVAAWLDTKGQHGCSLWLHEESNH